VDERREVKGCYSVLMLELTRVVTAGSRRSQDLLGPPLGGGSCDVTLSGASSQRLSPDRGRISGIVLSLFGRERVLSHFLSFSF